MSSTQFVEMYHPLIPSTITNPVRVSDQSKDDHAANGWLLVDPEVELPVSVTPYYSTAAADSRFVRTTLLDTAMTAVAGDADSDFAVEQRAASGTFSGDRSWTGDHAFQGAVDFADATVTGLPSGDLRAFNIHQPHNYGAVGDGSTNDTAAIQAAIDAAGATGKVIIPPGVYGVDLISNLSGTGLHGAILLRSGTDLEIQGGAEILLRPTQAVVGDNQTAIFRNANAFASAAPYDADIRVHGRGVLNGNAINNTGGLTNGFYFGKVSRPVVQGITVKNCRGTAPGAPGETLGVNFWRCLDFSVTDVQVFGDDGGDTATGIGSNQCVIGRVQNCSTHHLKHGVGNTHWDSSVITVADCHSYANGGFGFLTEHAEDVTFVNCVAGGVITDYDMASTNTGLSPIAGTVLGNGQTSTNTNVGGFGIDSGKRITLRGCTAAYNGVATSQDAPGVRIYGSTTLTSEILIDGCRLFGNRHGVSFTFGDGAAGSKARMRATRIVNSIIGPNKHIDGSQSESAIYTSSGSINVWKGTIPAFIITAFAPVAATGVPVQNPFPFDAEVTLSGGTVTAVTVTPGGPVPSAAYAVPATGPIRVPQGGSITVAHSVAPTWTWVIV